MYKLLTIIWTIAAVTSIVLWSSSCKGNKRSTTAARLPLVDISHFVKPCNVQLRFVSIVDQLQNNNIDLLTSF